MSDSLNTLATDIYQANKEKGFWEKPRPLTETTMLIVTELAEAVEEERAGRPSLWYRDHMKDGEPLRPDEVVLSSKGLAHHHEDFHGLDPDEMPPAVKPEGVDVELIDALIRLLDLLGSRGTDVDELLRQKLAYNASRPTKHGKAY